MISPYELVHGWPWPWSAWFVGLVVVGVGSRGLIVSERRITSLSPGVIADLVAELGPVLQARRDAELCGRRRLRAVGAGAKYKLVFVDRLLATLVHLRHGVTHDVLARWLRVYRSTITRAIGEIRPLLSDRGCRAAPGPRLRTLADVGAYLGATGPTGIIDATEIQVRRPAAHQPGRARFISGKSRMNAMKALVVTDARGRILFCGEVGSVADTIDLEILADADYQGLAAQTYGQVVTPPRKRRGKHLEHLQWLMAHHEQARFAHSSRRIPVEHGIAHLKNWKALARHHGHRHHLSDTVQAVAVLLSDQQSADQTTGPALLTRRTT
ncbi:transposase family protein [Streptomyces sp. V4-01]|uniref:Transposase family protein n=1 Tax=Actinacidiphila polyblastidii TaxID=3110430 RepID=A0ABU7PCZ7_9ACTN|nr:transposase family protein [Streptomyces sp. V4-01]